MDKHCPRSVMKWQKTVSEQARDKKMLTVVGFFMSLAAWNFNLYFISHVHFAVYHSGIYWNCAEPSQMTDGVKYIEQRNKMWWVRGKQSWAWKINHLEWKMMMRFLFGLQLYSANHHLGSQDCKTLFEFNSNNNEKNLHSQNRTTWSNWNNYIIIVNEYKKKFNSHSTKRSWELKTIH